jgi:hypothetical protein
MALAALLIYSSSSCAVQAAPLACNLRPAAWKQLIFGDQHSLQFFQKL